MYKILIQNENVEERSVLFDLLQEFDEEFELYEAKQHEEALRIIQNKNIQIMFTDSQANMHDTFEQYPYLEFLLFGSKKEIETWRQRIVFDNIRYVERPVRKENLKTEFLGAMHHMMKKTLEEQVWEEKKLKSERAIEKRVTIEKDEAIIKETHNMIRLKNGEGLKSEVEALFQQYADMEEQYPFYVRSVYMAVLQLFIKAVPSKMSEIEKMAEYIFTTEEFPKVRNLLRTYMELVIDEFENEANSSNRVIYQVKQYINLHYHEDLKLHHLAEQVYLSSNYLSNIFTKHTGCSLNKYIKEVRLKKAQELLLSTNMKVADVGRRVGYDNTSYFIKKFQEKFGVTPEKYRMKPIEQEEIWNAKK